MCVAEGRCALRVLTLAERGLVRLGEPDDAAGLWGHTASVVRVESVLITRGS